VDAARIILGEGSARTFAQKFTFKTLNIFMGHLRVVSVYNETYKNVILLTATNSSASPAEERQDPCVDSLI
jgi:hypothetical protein